MVSLAEAMKEPTVSVVSDLEVQSDTLLVAFGGGFGAYFMPRFEFSRMASDLPVKKLFIREHEPTWYQGGIPGLGLGIDEAAGAIRELVLRNGVDRTVMVGNSAGGYAALLFGELTGADTVLAFSPQTFVDRRNRLVHRDRRWPQPARRMRSLPRTPYQDLLRVLHGGATTSQVYYSGNHRLDRVHAERLRSTPGVVLHRYDLASHKLVRVLRDQGDLGGILHEALGLGERPDGPPA
jgi:pimeloyl-ACP methyl ester carboxylesterase